MKFTVETNPVIFYGQKDSNIHVNEIKTFVTFVLLKHLYLFFE